MTSTDDILETIDALTGPDAMSKKQALEFLQELSSQLEGRIEALNNEIEEGMN